MPPPYEWAISPNSVGGYKKFLSVAIGGLSVGLSVRKTDEEEKTKKSVPKRMVRVAEVSERTRQRW